MYKGKTVSVIFATYKEKKSIRSVIEDFYGTGFVDEIIVAHHSAEPGTEEEIKKTRARIIRGPKQHYGYSIQAALEHAKGDLIVLCEPDGTYIGRDIEKFLLFGLEYSVVFGTRTSKFTILSGADMGFWRKHANVLVAKIIELLFNTTTLTDVGCNYRLFRREALEKIKPLWKAKDAIFTLELMLLVVSERISFVEAPVTYRPRVGGSTLSENKRQIVVAALRFLFFIFKFWLRWIFKGKKSSPVPKQPTVG